MIISSLIAIATVLTMGVISPGPSFIYVARNAVNNDEAQYSGSGDPCPAGSRCS